MIASEKRVLIVVDWFIPGYKAGGPIKSIAGLVQLLGHECNIDLLTSDRDFQSDRPYENIQVDQWIAYSGNVRICYLSPGLALKKIIDLVRENNYSTVYTNSFFSFHYSIKIRLLKLLGYIQADKMAIAPRGEFQPARLTVKPLKKNIYLGFAKMIGLYRTTHWHATSADEFKNIQKVFGKTIKGSVLSNVSPTTKGNSLAKKIRNELKIVSLSRIISYKNLYFVLEVLQQLSLKEQEHLTLDIYGPIEDKKYWEQCLGLINSISSDRLRINYKGEIEGHLVTTTLSQYHLLFFPTLGENFGHVIFEALITGTPVLISDLTPWESLQVHNAGWSYPLSDKSEYVNVLNKMLLMDESEFTQSSNATRRYAESLVNNPELKAGYLKMLLE